ncbi:MAG TPA: RHS repeat-associated core domain-containing protein, partial [Blastocatellia bacterium]|nr:RHS repeat-associated core domain-containing protein [Blastocatellia bacterium]
DPASQTYQFSYTADGLMTGETDPRGNAYSFLYDSLGLLTRDDDPATGFQTLTRSGSIITSYTVTRSTALSRTESFQVQTLATEDLRRVFTDTAGLQTQSIEGKDGTNTDAYPDGMTTVLKLNGDPRWNLMAPLAGNNTITTPGGLAFNSTFARTATLSDPDNLLSLTAQNDTYTVNGRVFTNNYAAASRTFTFTTPAGRQTTTTINPQGRITSSQVADLDPSSFAYDSRGRLAMAVYGTGGAARSFSYAYNAGGFLSSITDPLTRVTSFVYDAAGRVTEQTLPGGRVIAYGYDANGNLTSITPPGRPAHVFNYTPVNLTSSYTPPAVPGTGQTTYAFNLDRQLTTVTRPGGQTLTFSYDSAGRLSTLAVPGGQYNYTYNSTTDNLTSISAPGGQGLSFIYDGSLITQATWAGTVAGSVGYTYDNNFRVTAQNVNGASPINFTYDNDDLLTGAGAMTLTRNAQHGLVTATTLGSVTTTLSYNGYAEAMNHSASFNATGLYACQYTYDKLGRITQKVETVLGSPTTYDYTYDAAGRLASVTLNGAPTPASAYTYDQNGNRTSASIGGVVTNGTYDNQDRLTQYGSTTYAYTASGELLSKSVGAQTTQYVYDVLGNLVAVTLPNGTQIEYVIDGQDLRVGKKVNGALVQGFLYDGQITIVAELDGANNIVSRFVYASRDNVPDFMIKGGVTYRIVSDHLGSPRLVVNAATGAVSQRIDYDEFGNVTLDTNPGFQPFGFAGGLYDRDTGLVRFGARDYDPATGRWTAKDPIMFDGGDTNLYGYVLGDPINLRDLNGLEPLTPSAGIGLPGIDRLFDGGRLDDPIGEEYLEQQQAKIDEVLKSLEDDAKKPESPEEQAKRISDDFASAEKAYRESLKRREASKQSNRDGKDKGKGDKGGRGKGGFCKRKK